jgi:hypothetical protein
MMNNNKTEHYWPMSFDDAEGPKIPKDIIAREILRKWYVGEHEAADELWVDFEAALKVRGYSIFEDNLKGFDGTGLLSDGC